MQNLEPHNRPTELNLHFNMILPGDLWAQTNIRKIGLAEAVLLKLFMMNQFCFGFYIFNLLHMDVLYQRRLCLIQLCTNYACMEQSERLE